MSKKTIKYIFELFYIFIIPLLLIILTSDIKFENEYVYDNEGNFLTSEETKNLSFDNSIIKYNETNKNYILNDYFEIENINSSVGDFTEFILNFGNMPDEILIDNPEENQYLVMLDNGELGLYIMTEIINNNLNITYYAYYDNNEESADYIYPNDNLNNETIILYTYNNGTFIKNNNINYNDIKLCIDYLHYPYNELIEQVEINYDLIYINKIENTIWGNMKESFEGALDLNSDSLVLDIIFCYIILWFIMFLSWHIIYMLFDKLFHIRRE